MAEYFESRQQLNQARDTHDELRQERDRLRRRLQQIDARLDGLQRQANPNNPGAAQQMHDLQAEKLKISDQLGGAENRLLDARKALDARYVDFFTFTNPLEFVSRLDDQLPFLLFPVRIETRFMASAPNVPGRPPGPEMWVRIYPDDCLIDTFEPTLSGSEITAARRYYTESWKAGGVEVQERAAWRGLVGSVGAGRAAWIIQHFSPLNPADKPAKADANEVVLVIATDQPLPVPQPAVFAYWQAVWAAKGDAPQLNTAYQNLLAAAGGDATLAEQIVQNFAPDNIRAWASSDQATASVVVLNFTPYPDLDTKNFSWTQAPKVNLFPDRFVLVGHNTGQEPVTHLFNPITLPLTVGPDPTDAQQFIENDGDLELGEEIRWMTDFDAAVGKGLGLRVPLSAQQFARGFERLFVIGIRLSADPDKNAADLEQLLHNHLYSRSGFALVPQGTPTNNTEESSSAFNRTDDADDSYDVFVKNATQYTLETDPDRKLDGQWFSEMLGLAPDALQQVPNAGQPDQCEARAMNTALWPATWGYYFEKMLHPVLGRSEIRSTRQFFKEFVTARGPVSALRIGRQPYGVLPVAPFRSLGWIKQLETSRDNPYLGRLYKLLLQLDDLWREMAGKIPQIGQAGDKDPQGTLLNILALHPGAEEIHTILGEPYYISYNVGAIYGIEGADNVKQTPDAAGGQLLQDLGYSGYDIPEILTRTYFGHPVPLHKQVVDDVPLSETAPVRDYTPQPDPLNYLEWLLKKGKESLDDLRKETGFTDNKPPAAVLYVFLRHALLLAYEAAARESKRLHVDDVVYQAWKKPANTIHVAATPQNASAPVSESPWAHLYLDFPALTQRTDYSLAQYITDNLATLGEADELRDLLASLEHLQNTPTARLDRLFREHLDLCHYRLDAWKTGLLNLQLSYMRRPAVANGEGEPQPRRGIHIGAYGWVENLAPSAKQLSRVELPRELADIFDKQPGLAPLQRDSSNGGFIHAPSLNHAVTAAVLRNGYRANATPDDPDLMAVNLSSERVRKAVGLIEGVRNGQKMGALLGYHFERELHDAGTGLDKFILELRNHFSLNAQKLKTTQSVNTPVEFIEANNVVDGFALMDYLDKHQNESDPLAPVLPGSTLPERNTVLAAARRLFDLADGVADVAVAESVHQVVMGNYERAAATMDAFAASNLPPEPEVVRTPRSGHTLTHRVGLHLRANVAAGAGATPRRQAEPSADDWLSGHLPPANQLGVRVKIFNDPLNPAFSVPVFVTQADLGLSPLDLLFAIQDGATQAATELDDLVLRFVTQRPDVRPDTRIELAFTEPELGKVTFFEATPLLASLRSLFLRSRPLTATDIQLPGEASDSKAGEVRLDKSRIDDVAAALNTLKTDVDAVIAALQPDADGDVLDNFDTRLAQIGQISVRANLFGIPHAGFAMAWQNRSEIYALLVAKLAELLPRWNTNLAASQAITAALPVPTDSDVPQLMEAGRLVTTAILPTSLSPADLHTEVLNRQTAFQTKRDALLQILNNTPDTLAALHNQLAAELPLTDFDAQIFDIADQTRAMQTLLDQWLLRTQALAMEIGRRLTATTKLMADYAAAADPTGQVKILQEAGKVLLGDEFRMIPSFKTTVAAGFEWKNSFDNSENLLDYVRNRPGQSMPFPIDEWLHGAARVREKMFHWENTVFLTGAFGRPEPELQPVQLPFRAGENWLALEFDPNNTANTLETERLLYTAHYTEAFQPANWQCGILVDEWTEVIPQKEELTGLAFHYDRPNAEPPQAWLLALPSAFRGEWQWDDLVASLHQTLDDARARAVEPDMFDKGITALLPAVLTESSYSPMTINANLIARTAQLAVPFIQPS